MYTINRLTKSAGDDDEKIKRKERTVQGSGYF
jgi:hypothetical protein